MAVKAVVTQENIILIDWFSVSSKIDSPDGIKELLGLNYPGINWQSIGGMHGYKDRYYFEGISIHYNGNEKMNLQNTVWLEMSGQGCRAFEQYSKHKDWFVMFSLILADTENYHLTRLDIAYDDWQGVLDIKQLKRESEKHNLVTQFRDYGVDMSFVGEDITLYYGSKKSDVLFRCYNKAAERDREEEIEHWIRFEIQLRDDHAFEFLRAYHANNSIGETFSGVVRHYLRFVKPSKSDSNKARWSVRPWWEKFLGSAEEISLFTQKGTDYNISKLQNFVINNVGNAIDTYLQIFGEKQFIKDLKNRKTTLSAKYKDLIDKHKRFEKFMHTDESGVELPDRVQKNTDDVLKFLEENGLT